MEENFLKKPYSVDAFRFDKCLWHLIVDEHCRILYICTRTRIRDVILKIIPEKKREINIKYPYLFLRLYTYVCIRI